MKIKTVNAMICWMAALLFMGLAIYNSDTNDLYWCVFTIVECILCTLGYIIYFHAGEK